MKRKEGGVGEKLREHKMEGKLSNMLADGGTSEMPTVKTNTSKSVSSSVKRISLMEKCKYPPRLGQ